MKKIFRTLAVFSLAAVALVGGASCSDKKAETKPAPKAKTAQTLHNLPNYRYVDLDTILSRYNLAKDYNEEMLRMQNDAESKMRQHQSRIQSFAATVQNKMQNNGYLTQESYESDEKKMANMQTEAQRAMSSLDQNISQAAAKAQKAVNDSIEAFIEDYNKTRGYDAIFFKAATLYIHPDLDITDEVVEGLNARYNKIKK